MHVNIACEGAGRILAARLHHMTADPGMRDMLAYLIARDSMHQNQWKAVLEELEDEGPQMPVPNSFPREDVHLDFSYVYLGFTADGAEPPRGRWSEGPSVDGHGEFSIRPIEPPGEVPDRGPASPGTYGQTAQMRDPEERQ